MTAHPAPGDKRDIYGIDHTVDRNSFCDHDLGAAEREGLPDQTRIKNNRVARIRRRDRFAKRAVGIADAVVAIVDFVTVNVAAFAETAKTTANIPSKIACIVLFFITISSDIQWAKFAPSFISAFVCDENYHWWKKITGTRAGCLRSGEKNRRPESRPNKHRGAWL